jgi:hypothetical protein
MLQMQSGRKETTKVRVKPSWFGFITLDLFSQIQSIAEGIRSAKHNPHLMPECLKCLTLGRPESSIRSGSKETIRDCSFLVLSFFDPGTG